MHEQQQQLESLRKKLVGIESKESNFLKIELVFYEAMDAARLQGDNPEENELLTALKHLQAGVYQDTKKRFKKTTQQDQVIRKFANQLKSILAAGIKNASLSAFPVRHQPNS
jgi:hypothetical protein